MELEIVLARLDINSSELAAALGCNRQSVYRWKKGTTAEGLQEVIVVEVARLIESSPDDVVDQWRAQVRAALRAHGSEDASLPLLRALIKPPTHLRYRMEEGVGAPVGTPGSVAIVIDGGLPPHMDFPGRWESTKMKDMRWILDADDVLRYLGQAGPPDAEGKRRIEPVKGWIGRVSESPRALAGERAATRALASHEHKAPEEVDAARHEAVAPTRGTRDGELDTREAKARGGSTRKRPRAPLPCVCSPINRLLTKTVGSNGEDVIACRACGRPIRTPE